MSSTISVIIPSYNGEATILAALRSVFAQTRASDEILVVDDGSNVEVAPIIEGAFPAVQVIRHKENLGVQAARNTGFAETHGEYVHFLDADDLISPKFLELSSRVLDARPSNGLCTTDFHRSIDNEIDTILETSSDSDANELDFGVGEALTYYLENTGAILPSFCLFRRSALEDCSENGDVFFYHGLELPNNEDFHLFARVLSTHAATQLRCKLGAYRLHDRNASKNLLKSWQTRAKAAESLLDMQDRFSFTSDHLMKLRRMRASAVRRYGRLLASNGHKYDAARYLFIDFLRSGDVKILTQAMLILAGVTSSPRRFISKGKATSRL